MDTPTRLGVARLVHQRGAGEITREEFFQRLAALQSNLPAQDGGQPNSPVHPPTSLHREEIGGASPDSERGQEVSGLGYLSAIPHAPALSSASGANSSTPSSMSNVPRLLTGEAALAMAQHQIENTDVVPSGCAREAWGPPTAIPSARSSASRAPHDPLPQGPVLLGDARSHQSRGASAGETSLAMEETASAVPSSPASTSWETPRKARRRSFANRSTDSLFASFAQRNELWDYQRTRRCEELRRHKEAQEIEKCTFQPNVAKSMASYRQHVNSSSVSVLSGAGAEPTFKASTAYHSSSSANKVEKRDLLDKQRLEFIPQTNRVPTNMLNARAYLSEDVFTRLSQPVADDYLEASMLSDEARSRTEASTAGPSFIEFLQRQNEFEEERLQRLDFVDFITSPSFHPKIDERSARLAERRKEKANQSAYAMSARPSRGAMLATVGKDTECSFKPKINKASAEREARSLTELSVGDFARTQAKVLKLRERLEAQGMQGVTFQPKLRTSSVPGRMRLLEDPDAYLQRLEKEDARKAKWREEELKRRREHEMKECRFRPEVKPAPAFVRQMAESYRMVQAMKEKENRNVEEGKLGRPEWR